MQKFKADQTEIKMIEAARPALDQIGESLEAYYNNAGTSSPFLYMLYDTERAPFSTRVPREAFIEFINEALERFPFSGTFECLIFILEAIFGEGTIVNFLVTAPGKLEILVNAATLISYDFVAEQFNGSEFEVFDVIDHDGNTLAFVGISGIQSQNELAMLLAEIRPAGIVYDVQLGFFELYDFIADEGDEIHDMVDHENNTIVFLELGE